MYCRPFRSSWNACTSPAENTQSHTHTHTHTHTHAGTQTHTQTHTHINKVKPHDTGANRSYIVLELNCCHTKLITNHPLYCVSFTPTKPVREWRVCVCVCVCVCLCVCVC